METRVKHHPVGAEQVADWIETLLLAADTTFFSNDRLDDLAGQQGLTAGDMSLGIAEMSRREAILGDAYPFAALDFAVQRRDTDAGMPYVALLLMTATAPVRRLVYPQPPVAVTLLIERLAVNAMRSLLGPGAKALRFGIPSDVGRPTDFNQAVHWLADQMGAPVGTAFRPPRRADGGLDVVAWRPFPDRRPGMPVMFVQCTVQEEFADKTNDINLDDWAGWLHLDVAPTKVLVVPDVLPAGEKRKEVSARALVLDRPRVAHLVASADPEEVVGLEEFVENCRREARGAMADEVAS